MFLSKTNAMCYHTALTAPHAELERRYGRQLTFDFEPSYHVSAFSHAEYPIVTDGPGIRPMRWGLIPFWTDTLEDALAIRNRTLNARAETIFKKPSFREPIKKKRCLVPASGFFDWRHEETKGKDKMEKIPYYITVKDEPILSFAGIFDTWRNPENGELVQTYSIITTEANPMMRYIHNTNFRMPVILHPEQEADWLNPALTETGIGAMLRPFDSDDMRAYAIGRDFLRKNPHDSAILNPLAPPVLVPAP